MTTPISPDKVTTSKGNGPDKKNPRGDVLTSQETSSGIVGNLPGVPPQIHADPLVEYVKALPLEITAASRQVSTPIAQENATTHGSKTLAEFTQLKRKERDGELLPGEAEYFRYGTETTRRVEAEIAKKEQGQAAAVFKSAKAAVTCTLEALLPLSPERIDIVVEKEWYARMADYFKHAAPPGAFNVTVVPSRNLEDFSEHITSRTAMVILGNLANEASPEQLAFFTRSERGKNPQVAFLADRPDQEEAQSPLASGVDLILPSLHKEFDSDGVACGAVVGDKTRIARIAEIRGQIGTIASDPECAGNSLIQFNSYSTGVTREAEKELAAIEKGEAALVFRSGMAAIHALLMHVIQRTDDKPVHVIMGSEGYRQTLNILLDRLRPRNEVELTVIPMEDFAQVGKHIKENTAAVFFETPSNPFLNVTSVRKVAEEVKARRSKALVVVDHTFASPYNQTPLTQGADVVIPSLTKYVGGTNKVGAGAIVGTADFIAALTKVRAALGSIASDQDGRGAMEGLKTLPERMERANRNGLHVAQILERHADSVRKVWYPGLASHPDHAVAQEQMTGGFGGVVSFRLNTNSMSEIEAFVDAFIDASSPGTFLAPSFGGDEPLISVVTVVSHFKQTLHERAQRGIPLDLIRLSVGTGNPECLTAALRAGFEALEERKKQEGLSRAVGS